MTTLEDRSGTPLSRTSLRDWVRRTEAPTWVLIFGCYGAFGAITWYWDALPLWATVPALAYLICLFGHIQHEVLHGHPTRSDTVNRILIGLPLALWIPYEIYKDSHIAHHKTDHLTDPTDDPESFYVTEARWRRLSRPHRALLSFTNSFAGRMIVGPALVIYRFWRDELARFARGDFTHLKAWTLHFITASAVLYWLFAICAIDPMAFLLAFYPGLSLTLLRSYVEHRPAADQDQRCAVVEAGPVMSLLYLNNNLHIVHHTVPGLPWYEIPTVYHRDRQGWLARNGGYRYDGYGDVLKRHLITPKDKPVHPHAA